MIKWEYRIETQGISPKEWAKRGWHDIDDQNYHEFEDLTDDWLNDIGKDGWKLENIKYTNVKDRMTAGKKVYFFFKRPAE